VRDLRAECSIVLRAKLMLIEILKRTPSWVFVLFFALLAWGYFQSKDRIVSRSQVSILPVAMIDIKRVASAVGEGSISISFVHRLLRE